MDLLDDLGAQLRALSADQPAQPGDRVPAVTRTARRIRRTRAAVAVASAVAVLAPASLLVSSVQHHDATSFAHSDVLTWPDRSLPVARSVANGALAAVEAQTGAAMDLKVRWLYRGSVPLPDHSPAYLAVFTTTLQSQRVLFTVSSVGTQLDEHGRSGPNHDELPWAIDRVALDDGHAVDHVGAFFDYSVEERSYNLAVLLADPRARIMTWQSRPIPFAPRIEARSSTAPARSSNGVFVTSLGPLTGPVTATVSDARGHHATYPAATGRAHITLLQSTTPDLPPGSQFIAGGSSESEQTADGTWTWPISSDESVWPQPKRAVYVRCYGGGELVVALNSNDADPTMRGARIPCDNVSHRAFIRAVVAGHATLSITSDRLQEITYALVGVY